MRLYATILALSVSLTLLTTRARAADPESTVRAADTTLREVMSMALSSIPQGLLNDCHGVAIIPDVIKVGFIAGVRRGHGVVLVRDDNRNWTLPQFVTLTGGSVGWQAGVSGTDVVLVFMTKKSIEGLLNGKFTIGADAAAAAGPVGRNAAAATDFRLKAEILSYSRSRGLFAGIALDGSAIEIDSAAHSAYYGALAGTNQIPQSASILLGDLESYTRGAQPMMTAPPQPTAAPPSYYDGPTLPPIPAR